jgi:hypothetical protein
MISPYASSLIRVFVVTTLIGGCSTHSTIDASTAQIKFYECGAIVTLNGTSASIPARDINRLTGGLMSGANWQADGQIYSTDLNTQVAICTCRDKALDEMEVVSTAGWIRDSLGGRGSSETVKGLGRVYDFAPRISAQGSEERFRLLAMAQKKSCLLTLIAKGPSGNVNDEFFRSVRTLTTPTVSPANETSLRKIDELLGSGAISKDQYELLRAQILLQPK